jgi:hypothetical protein
MGCRLYPQVAMRVRNVSAGTPAVAALHATITLVANNADASNLAGALKSIATGKLSTSLFCESNRANAGAAVDKRKLATMRSMKIAQPDRLKPPPHWSWNYDYCRPAITKSVPFIAVRARRDGTIATTSRDATEVWPTTQTATTETIHKVPRQGAYDSLCIHPDRGTDASNQPVVLAPWCADLGLHLAWRRGVSSSAGPVPLHVFRGWGEGRFGQGAHTVLGAPLVPPNQHVDVTVAPAADRSTVTVNYAVTASEIAANRWQVFLEQGLAFAFQYAAEGAIPADRDGLPLISLAWLAEASGSVPAGGMGDVMQRLLNAKSAPDQLDAAVRDVWLSILERSSHFDTSLDGSTDQQIPNGPSDPVHLENL